MNSDILRELAEFEVPAMCTDAGTSETRKRPREEAGDEGDYGGVPFNAPEWAFPMDAAEVMESRQRHEPHSYALDDFIFGAGFGDINALGTADSAIGQYFSLCFHGIILIRYLIRRGIISDARCRLWMAELGDVSTQH